MKTTMPHDTHVFPQAGYYSQDLAFMQVRARTDALKIAHERLGNDVSPEKLLQEVEYIAHYLLTGEKRHA